MLDRYRAALKSTIAAREEAAAIMRRQGLKIHDLGDPMQKLAFTLYTLLAEQAERARTLLEDEEVSRHE